MQDVPSQTQTQLVLALLVLVLVSLCVMVSWSLLVLVAVLVLVWVCVLVGLLVLVMVAVTLVVGDPISVMLMEMGVLCAAIHAKPAPRPSNISKNISFYFKQIFFYQKVWGWPRRVMQFSDSVKVV